MLSEKMNDALNRQVNAEFYSSYLYLSMSAYFEPIKMKGLASWMRVQAGEELVHAMKMYDYVISAGGRARMLPVDAPRLSWASPLEAFQNVYDHERRVTGLIHALVDVAISENDEATKSFLQWFMDEQVEEEDSSDTVLNKVKGAGNNSSALRVVDNELSQRHFKFPGGYQLFEQIGSQGITIGSLKK